MEYGLIGEKLGHSFSKDIHGKIGDYQYDLKEIAKDDVDSFMKAKDFKAINVTIPYKQTVIPYLDEISEGAREIGAVNCIVNKKGRLCGYNTDFDGMRALILKNHIDLSGKKVLILGTGGTSKTATAVAKSLGASRVLVVSRTKSEGIITYDEMYEHHKDADAIINTTPVGMYPKVEGTPVDLTKFSNLSGVIDAIFNPLRTNLIMEAKRMGIPAEGGLYMLVMQAIVASEYFFDTTYDKSLCDSIYSELLMAKENVVLIGMPASGKSTVGSKLAKKLSIELVDSDSEIVKTAGKSIPDIFSEDGETHFRELETNVLRELSMSGGKVIATGGGAVLKPENVKNLKQNGKIIFIDRPLADLIPTDDRPLANSKEKIEKLYKERYEIYKNAADVTINAVGNVDWVVREIIKRLG